MAEVLGGSIEGLDEPDRLEGWSLESWEEAMRDIEDAESEGVDEYYKERDYYCSVQRCVNVQNQLSYAEQVYGPSVYESDTQRADKLLARHLAERDAKLSRLQKPFGGAALSDVNKASED